MKSTDNIPSAVMQRACYLVGQPILGAGDYPEAARLVAQSGRLRRDLQEELDYYNNNPDCDNVRIWHCVHQGPKASYWLNRWGQYAMVFRSNRWHLLDNHLFAGPAMKKKFRPAYSNISMNINGRALRPLVHVLMSDIFIPNDDLTKTERDHINGNHLDNNALNLERVTPEENIRRRWYNYYLRHNRPVPTRFLPP